MKGLAIISIFITFLISCGQKKEDSRLIPLNVVVDDTGEDILMSSLVDTVSIISLDNTELIGRIDDLVWAENRILILDRSIAQKVYIYDLKGNLIKSISSGDGEPGRFVFPSALTLSVRGNSFFVISGRSKRILEYDLDGELIEDYNVKDLGHLDDLHSFSDGFAIKLRPDTHSGEDIFFTDLDFKKTDVMRSSDFFQEPPFQSGGAWNYFYPTNQQDRFFYKDVMSNKIFEIDNRKVSKIFDIDLPDSYEINYALTGRSIPEVNSAIKERGLVGLGNNHLIFGDFMLLEIFNAGWGRLAILNLAENKMKFISNVINDLTIISDVNAIWGSYNNAPGNLITAVEAPLLLQMFETFDYKTSPYAPIFDNLEVAKDDNPILIVYKLKQDYQWPFD